MNPIIICNRLEDLISLVNELRGSLRFISLVETRESRRIGEYLNRRPETKELPRAELMQLRRDDFRASFIDFMGRLNASNRSPLWWAMTFTNKNPILTPWCRLISDLLLIVDLSRHGDSPLVVISDSSELAASVKVWGKQAGIPTSCKVRTPSSWRSALRRVPTGGVLISLVKTFWLWLHVRSLKPPRDAGGDYTVVTSVMHARSFAAPGKYRDAYFGDLVDELPRRHVRSLVFGLFHEGWRQQLARLKALEPGISVIPSVALLNLWDLAACGLSAGKAALTPVKIRGDMEIDGVDLTSTMKEAVREAHSSGGVFISLSIYRSARRLAQRIDVARCIYPYENRDWEKMLLLGIKSASPKTRMVGYQHASVTPSHTNFILEKDEAESVPLPDALLTTGVTVKDWLEEEGNYPPATIKAACALRQGQPATSGLTPRPDRVVNILSTLATGMEEYVNTLVFLEQAFFGNPEFQVRVRPHPNRPLESAMEIAPLARQDFFSPSTGSLAEDLEWADVVLYASTTVGLEAVSMGIPAICLDLGEFLDTDPMFGWDEFKWAVRTPSELVKTLRHIQDLPNQKYQELQRSGVAYVSSYLTPVAPDYLRLFWEG